MSQNTNGPLKAQTVDDWKRETEAGSDVRLVGMSADIVDRNMLRLHFNRPVTDADRAAVVECLNSLSRPSTSVPSDGPDTRKRFRAGVRWAITWLHEHAKEMRDPHAVTVLNVAAFQLGVEFKQKHGSITAAYAIDLTPSKSETDAERDVLAERKRQIEAEGWTSVHDDDYEEGELAKAAACYALAGTSEVGTFRDVPQSVLKSLWPWDEQWWKPKDNRRNLVKAGALILAEIERLDRESALQQGRK